LRVNAFDVVDERATAHVERLRANVKSHIHRALRQGIDEINKSFCLRITFTWSSCIICKL